MHETGISIEVYGTTTTIEDFPGAVSNYSIDGTNISTFRSPTVATPGYRTQFFKSPTLSDGRHSLLVTLVNRASFYVDSLVINTQDEVKPESMPPPSNPQSTSQGGQQGDTHTATKEKTSIFTSLPPSTTSVSLSLSPSQSPSTPPSPNGFPNTDQGSHTTTSSQSLPTIGGVSQSSPEATGLGPSPKKPVPIGAIAGATAAGVLVVVLAFFFLWRYRRRSVKYTELPKPRPDVASMHKNGTSRHSTIERIRNILIPYVSFKNIRCHALCGIRSHPLWRLWRSRFAIPLHIQPFRWPGSTSLCCLIKFRPLSKQLLYTLRSE